MKISVLTPTFNRASFLERVYRSLLKNKECIQNIEWLIMDDGSTDNTKSVIEKLKDENEIEITKKIKEKWLQ